MPTPKKKSWFSIRALSGDDDGEVEVSIYDVIGLWGVSAKDFADALKAYSGRDLTVRINSPGGAITEGTAMYNALQRHDGEVTTCIDGLAASMATYVALAGSKVCMAQNAYFMIHNPAGGADGEASDLRKTADILDKMKGTLISAYAAKTGLDDDEISEMMDDETWLTAEEAKEKGFIDEITEPIEATAKFEPKSLTAFKKIPERFNATASTQTPKQVDTAAPAMTIEQLQAKVAELNGQLSKMTNRHAAAAKQAQDNFKEITDLREKIEDITNERDQARNEVTALHGDVKKLKGEAKTAGEQAAQINAELGVPPVRRETVESPENNGKKTVTELRAAFDAEKDNRKRAGLWRQLEAAMDEAAGGRKR